MGSRSAINFFLCIGVAISIALYITDILREEGLRETINLNRYYEKTNENESSLSLDELGLGSGSDLMKEDEKDTEHHSSNDAKGGETNNRSEFTCAPWISNENRKIVMVSALKRFVTWEDHLKGIIKGGEPYWSACIDYVLRELGFEVTVQFEQLDPVGETMQQLERGEIHRIITDSSSGGNFADGSIWGMPELLCKVRMMVWWPFVKRPRNEFSILPMRYDETSTTSAHFVPFFAHQIVTEPPIKEIIGRSRRAIFIFAKITHQIVPEVILALYDAGFELHFQCDLKTLKPDRHPILNEVYGNFTFHPKYATPQEYTKELLQKVAMVLGFGDPVDSPTPIEALYNGAAFLNPLYERDFNGHKRSSMHRALVNVGPPYVYNYNASFFEYGGVQLKTLVSSVLEAAERASAQPFASFTPADYRLDAVKAHVCANIIEYDPCHIPGQK